MTLPAAPFALVLVAGLAGWLAVRMLIPPALPWLRRYAMARPNARSSHREPVPQGAGALVAGAVVLAGILALPLAAAPGFALAVLAASALLALLGAVDDLRPLPAGPRLALQAACVGAVLAAAPAEWRLVEPLPLWLERGLALIAGVWFVNLTNFMDGIDEITVAGFVPLAGAAALLAATGWLPVWSGVTAAALAGALAGFRRFNRHPAKVFLGDVGSLPVGLLGAALLFEVAARVSIAAALLLPMYHVCDATLTLLARARAGERLFEPHRRHAYQAAVDGGWRAPQVSGRVALFGLLMTVLAGLAIAVPALGWPLVALGLGLALLLMRRFRRPPP